MDIIRAVTSGVMVWIFVFSTFLVLSLIPGISASETWQAVVVCIMLVLYSFLGARYYYRKGAQTNGLVAGLLMAGVILLLDAVITVPLVIYPAGGDHFTFFTSLVLWVLVLEHLLVTFLYWRLKVPALR